MARSIPLRVKRIVRQRLMKDLEEYFRVAEEAEDDDIIRDTQSEGRLNDFAMYYFNTRFKRA